MGKDKKRENLCGGCVFCHDFTPPGARAPSDEMGQCKRLPPQVVIVTIKADVVTPQGGESPQFSNGSIGLPDR